MRKTSSNSSSPTLVEIPDTIMPKQQEISTRAAEKPAIKSLLGQPDNKAGFWTRMKGLVQEILPTKTTVKKTKNKEAVKTSPKFKRKNTTRKPVPQKQRRPERKRYKNTSRHSKSVSTTPIAGNNKEG